MGFVERYGFVYRCVRVRGGLKKGVVDLISFCDTEALLVLWWKKMEKMKVYMEMKVSLG